MGKRKNADQLMLEEAKKTLKEAPKRSLEYKEALKLVEQMEGKKYVESDAEVEESEASEQSDSSEDEDEEEEDEDEEEEEEEDEKPKRRGGKKPKKEPKAGTSAAKKKAPAKKTRKAAASTIKKPKAGTKAATKGKGKRAIKTLTRSFVKDKDESTNEYYYEAQIGQGHVVQLSKYLKTGNNYFSIRKPGTAGVTISVEFFENLRDALKEIREKFADKLSNED